MSADTAALQGAPRVRFPARERRGVILGLTGMQLGMIAVAVVAFITLLMVNPMLGLAALAPCILVIVLATVTWRREPVLLLLLRSAGYLQRAAAGQTRYRRDVWETDRRTDLEPAAGPPPDGPRPGPAPEPPRVFSTFTLPGPLGDVQLVQIPGAGAFAYDARTGKAAVTVEVHAGAWELRDPAAQEAAYTGFVDFLAGLEHTGGLDEAVVRIRVDRASTSEMMEYVQQREYANAPQVSDELKREYYQLIKAGSRRSMAFAMHATLAFDTHRLAGLVKNAGGGLAGISAVLAERVAAIRHSLEHAGLRAGAWLPANDLELAMTTAADPVAVAAQRERATTSQYRDIDALPVMAVDEGWGWLHIDQSWHQTSWIAEWPRTEARTGFLEPLLYGGDHSRVIALQLRPVPIHKAIAEVQRAQADVEASANIRMRMRSTVTVAEEREAEALHQREVDLVDGYGDVAFRGFVTVSADSEKALRAAQAQMVDASHQAHVVLSCLYGQQAAAFTAAAMPVAAGRGK